VAVKVGFVGLGNIGLPMARNIVKAGLALTVFDVNPAAAAELSADGARVAADLPQLGRECDCIGVCVRDDSEVEQVLLGDQGLFGVATAGTIIAIHSTIRPHTVRRFAEIGAAQAIHVLDVPISGGAQGARTRSLCYMAGGNAQLIERCRPVFEASAAKIVLTGPVGSGMTTKLCNNLMQYLGFVAAYEGRRLATRAGIGEETLKDATEASGILTRLMRAYLDMHRNLGAVLEGDALQDQLEKFTDLAEKDLAITLEFARELGVSLPATALCRQLMAQVYGLDKRRQNGQGIEG
jgi:3-hydroxyisobutyrate dehydrogenase